MDWCLSCCLSSAKRPMQQGFPSLDTQKLQLTEIVHQTRMTPQSQGVHFLPGSRFQLTGELQVWAWNTLDIQLTQTFGNGTGPFVSFLVT
jgi:hypothetical protein